MPDIESAEIEARYYQLDVDQQYLLLMIEKTEEAPRHPADAELIAEYSGHLEAFRRRRQDQEAEMGRLRPVLAAERDRQIDAARLRKKGCQ